MKNTLCITIIVVSLVAFAALGDNPPSQTDDTPTLQLGKISVTGRPQVLRALQAIKIGLRTPISGSKKDRNKIVCRIHNEIGSHVQQILTCAPNWQLARIRFSWQTALMTGQASIPSAPAMIEAQEILQSITSTQQNNMFSMGVNPNFQPMLDKLPDLAPAPTSISPPVKPDQP